MESIKTTKTNGNQTQQGIEDQKQKLLLLFFLLKKLRISFKTEMFIALVKTPTAKKHFDKWAFIFRSSSKLPFGLEELQTLIEMAKVQLEGLIGLEAKEVMYDIKGKKEKCFAVTFEVDLSHVKGAAELEQGLQKGLLKGLKRSQQCVT